MIAISLTAEQLLQWLKNEGSFEEYYRYLAEIYGIPQYGSVYSMQVKDQYCTVTGRDPDFAKAALERDLKNKSLEKIAWIAEEESKFTPKPYLAALDRYYRLNADTYNSREELQEAVNQFEQIHGGHAHFVYAPEHEHKDD